MQLKFGYKDEVVRRKRFISKSTGKIEDEYIAGLLKEEWIINKTNNKNNKVYVK